MPEVPQDPATPTTIQITRGQRAELAAVAARLTAAKGRHVSTKEAFDDLINFWKEGHRDDQ